MPRNRPDRRRLFPWVPYQDAGTVTPTIVVAGGEVRMTFPEPMQWDESAVLNEVFGCYDGNTKEPGSVGSIEISEDNTKVVVTLEFNLETHKGVFWIVAKQKALVAQSGHTVFSDPYVVPVV